MDIQDIYERYDLTVRSLNVCLGNNLYDSEALKKHYFQHKTFRNLRNCGDRSSKELIEICKLFDDSHDNYGDNLNFVQISDNLNLSKRNLISKFIKINTSYLSIRSQNAIKTVLNGDLRAKSFMDMILINDDFDLSEIKNIGSRSIPELTDFINKIRSFILQVSATNEDQELNKININFLIAERLGGTTAPDAVCDSNKIFTWCQYVISHNIIFNERQSLLLQKLLNIHEEESDYSLDRISKEFKLTKERVRQLRNAVLEQLPDKLMFLQHIPDDLNYIYLLNGNNNFIIIDEETALHINSVCNTTFTKQFITFILHLFLKDRFDLIGNVEDGIVRKQFTARNRHNWSGIYLVAKEFASEFNFSGFISDIYNRRQEKIEETYTFNFKSYLSNFLVDRSLTTLEQVLPFCEALVNLELNLYLDTDDNIIFERNTIKQINEYAFVALENLGKPSTVAEIHDAVKSLFPHLQVDAGSIRAAMKGIHGFVPIGRNSIFGLKKWENEIENFKGGTIRNIVYEFLVKFDEPKHISDITLHGLKFRPKTNQYSILTNLKQDSSQSFRFFRNSFIGLKSKTYSSTFVQLTAKENSAIRTWDESLECLSEFLAKYNKYPQCKSEADEDELVLYRWFRIQRKKLKDGTLEPSKNVLLTNVIDNFSKVSLKPRVEDNYETVIKFIEKYKRLPAANVPSEIRLYYFLQRQKRLFNNKKLPQNYKQLFLTIAKQLNQIGC